MKTLYAYCPSCRIPVKVDSFAGRTVYMKHFKPDSRPCKRSNETCYHTPRDHFAGAPRDIQHSGGKP